MRSIRESDKYWAVIHFKNDRVIDVFGPFITEGGAQFYAEHCANYSSPEHSEGHRWHVTDLTNPDSYY